MAVVSRSSSRNTCTLETADSHISLTKHLSHRPVMNTSATTSLSKVTLVTLLFWIIKIAATALGETGGDAKASAHSVPLVPWTCIRKSSFQPHMWRFTARLSSPGCCLSSDNVNRLSHARFLAIVRRAAFLTSLFSRSGKFSNHGCHG